MGKIIGLNGLPINEEQSRKITKSQAAGIVISEIDAAVLKWNQEALASVNGDRRRAHLFEVNFNQYEYSEEAKEKSGLFGYATLTVVFEHDGVKTEVYNKGQNFAKQRDLENKNGYMPDIIFDCIGFLIASGFMYNLAIANPNQPKTPKNATRKTETSQPGSDPEGNNGDGDRPANSKRRSRVSR